MPVRSTFSFARHQNHSGRLLRVGAVAVLVALFVVGTSSTSASAQGARHRYVRVAPTFFGIHDKSGRAYEHLTFGSLRLWDAGVTWKDVETSPDSYDWTRLDSLVSAARARHVQVVLVVGMTPAFYAAQPTEPPSDLRTFRDYVRAVMERYRRFRGERGIATYQVWNEGNVRTFWTGSPHQLAQVTRVVDHVRDRVDPAAHVLAPSFAVRLEGQRRWLASYQRQRVSGRRVWRFYDANALSLYPKASYAGRRGVPEDAMALLSRVRRQLAMAGVPRGKPIWASEVNFGVRSGPAGLIAAHPVSDSHQVANVMRTYLLAAANGLARVFWYRYDWGEVPGGGTLGNTLLSSPDDAGRITPAGRSFITVEHWLRGRLLRRAGAPAL